MWEIKNEWSAIWIAEHTHCGESCEDGGRVFDAHLCVLEGGTPSGDLWGGLFYFLTVHSGESSMVARDLPGMRLFFSFSHDFLSFVFQEAAPFSAFGLWIDRD
jgi:hypothetical protein